jgi:hypothetical protein
MSAKTKITASTIAALAATALALTGSPAAEAIGGWQLVTRASDRNSHRPTASIFAEHIKAPLAIRAVTYSSARKSRVRWTLACWVDNYVVIDGRQAGSGPAASWRDSKTGYAWVGRGRRTVALRFPAGVPAQGYADNGGRYNDIDCYAAVVIEAWTNAKGTATVWLQAQYA